MASGKFLECLAIPIVLRREILREMKIHAPFIASRALLAKVNSEVKNEALYIRATDYADCPDDSISDFAAGGKNRVSESR